MDRAACFALRVVSGSAGSLEHDIQPASPPRGMTSSTFWRWRSSSQARMFSYRDTGLVPTSSGHCSFYLCVLIIYLVWPNTVFGVFGFLFTSLCLTVFDSATQAAKRTNLALTRQLYDSCNRGRGVKHSPTQTRKHRTKNTKHCV